MLICDFVYPAGLIDWKLPCPKILFTHNVEAQLWKQQFDTARHHRGSEQNRAFFARYVQPGRVSTIATGVDIDFFRPADCAPSDSMVFTGSIDWAPNQQGVLFFASQILPHIHTEVPDADLWIVGRYPGIAIQQLAGPRIQAAWTIFAATSTKSAA